MRDIRYLANCDAQQIGAQLDSWIRTSPDGAVLAFVAEADRHAIPDLQSLCRERGIPLYGAVFPELLYDNRMQRRGLLLFRMPLPCGAQLIEGLSKSPPAEDERLGKMAEVAHSLPENARGTLLLFFDAMVPNIESWLEILYRRVGRQVHYLGVNAGSETFQPMPCLFDAERIREDAVLVLALPDMPGGVLEHGYRPPEKIITATTTEGNRILTIDWRPALEVYAELARQHYGVEITRENFYEHAVHFPFGIMRASGDLLVRIPVAIDEDGALFCIGEVPENAILTLLSAASVDPDETVARLVADFGESASDTILAFYCAGRRMHDPRRAERELQRLAERTRGCLAGALSLGEIGSSRRDGYPLFHNATLICADWKPQ